MIGRSKGETGADGAVRHVEHAPVAFAIPAPPRFKCPSGHETGGKKEGVFYGSTTIGYGGESLCLDDACPRCLFDWIRATFPTARQP